MASNFIKLIKFKNPRSNDFSGKSFTFRNVTTPNNLNIKPLSINDGYISPSAEGIAPQQSSVANLESINGNTLLTISGDTLVTI